MALTRLAWCCAENSNQARTRRPQLERYFELTPAGLRYFGPSDASAVLRAGGAGVDLSPSPSPTPVPAPVRSASNGEDAAVAVAVQPEDGAHSDGDWRFVVSVSTSKRSTEQLVLSAATEAEMHSWIAAIESAWRDRAADARLMMH